MKTKPGRPVRLHFAAFLQVSLVTWFSFWQQKDSRRYAYLLQVHPTDTSHYDSLSFAPTGNWMSIPKATQESTCGRRQTLAAWVPEWLPGVHLLPPAPPSSGKSYYTINLHSRESLIYQVMELWGFVCYYSWYLPSCYTDRCPLCPQIGHMPL